MEQTGQVILEIIKISIPALIVFLTAYYTMRGFFKSRLQSDHLKLNSENRKSSLEIRLKACERLALFCERINPPHLLLRLHTKDMTNEDLHIALMVSVQKEYEHNLVQQIYISENLWKIILLAKDYIVRLIEDNYEGLETDNNSQELAHKIIKAHNTLAINPFAQSLNAIKKETDRILG